MEWTVILTSVVVSAVVTVIGNVLIKNLEFNYDYRKYILEKRKVAYSEAEKIINELLIKTHYDTTPKTFDISEALMEQVNPLQFDLELISNKNELIEFRKRVIGMMNFNFWFTKNFSSLAIELYGLIDFYYKDFDKLEHIRVSTGLGTLFLHTDELKAIYDKLSKQYLTDIEDLKSLTFLVKK